MKIFVYIDHFKGEAQATSWEALGLAKSFGATTAIVFGSGVDDVAKAALEYGADDVLVADDLPFWIFAPRDVPSTLSALASSRPPT
ncbi:MAG: hypothetical protein U0X93_06560 [Anaerolineales bacterium]